MKNLKDFINEGAWGYDILQNDSTRDELCGTLGGKILIDYLNSIFTNCKEDGGCDSRWTAIGVYVYVIDNFYMNDGELQLTLKDTGIIEKLEIMVNNAFNDKRWLSNWSNPIEMVQVLNKIVKKIESYKRKVK